MRLRDLQVCGAGLVVVLLGAACESKPPEPEGPPPKTPAELAYEREKLLREAAARVEAAKAEKRKELLAYGTGRLSRKKLSGGAEPKLELEFEFENTSDKDLLQAEGALQIEDASGVALKNIKVPFRMDIKAGKTVSKSGKFPYDPKNEADNKLATLKLGELKVTWQPQLYRLADGTELRAE